MAISAFAIWEVESGGSDTANGGGFDPSQTAGMFTDGAATVATGSSPVFTSASYNFVAGDVGAWVYIGAGTNWIAGWYNIASVASNAATLSAAIGSAVLSTGGSTAVVTAPSTAIGCATTASPTGATWSIDYSQQSAAQFSYTDLASTGTGLTVSSVAHPFAKQQVGNVLVVASGTNFNAGRYVIASVAASVATVQGPTNITTGVGASGVGGMGGALVSPGKAGSLMASGHDIFLKSNGTTPYTVTSASNNVANGCVALPAGSSASNLSQYIGYGSVRCDDGTLPIVKANGSISSFSLCTANASDGNIIRNIQFDGNSGTASTGVSVQGNSVLVYKCNILNCTSFGVRGQGTYPSTAILCSCTNCSASATYEINCYNCVSYNHTSSTAAFFGGPNAAVYVNCIAYGGTGATAYGFALQGTDTCINCTAYNNAGDGFNVTVGVNTVTMINCYAEKNGGYGFNASAASNNIKMITCAAGFGSGANASGAYNTSNITIGEVISFINCSVSGSAFTNAGGNDFSLNNLAGLGAVLRSAGLPGVSGYPGTSTASYPDIGAAQHLTGIGIPPIVNCAIYNVVP